MGSVNSHMGARWTFGSRLPRAGSPALAAYFRNYIDKVLLIAPDNLVAYWPLWDASGPTAEDISPNGHDGTYNNCTLGAWGIDDGNTAAQFDGSNSNVNIYSAGLNADFDGAEGTLLAWAKVSGSDVWTDGALRTIIYMAVDSDNRVFIRKSTTDNTLDFYYIAGGTPKNVSPGSQSFTSFTCLAISWSAAADEMKAFIDGVQTGSTQTSLGTWTGDLDSATTCIGAASSTPASVMDGYIAHAALWNRALDAAEIEYLSAP